MTHSTAISVDKILATKDFVDFLHAARSFCSFIESQHSDRPKEFLVLTQSHLINLYSVGQSLPSIVLQTNVENEPEVADDALKQTLQFIGDRISHQFYWHVSDPTDDTGTEAVCGDLIDDLGDIYKDIKRSLLLFDMDGVDFKENAIWQFKFDFVHHWGDHCSNALYAIHYFLQKDG